MIDFKVVAQRVATKRAKPLLKQEQFKTLTFRCESTQTLESSLEARAHHMVSMKRARANALAG